MKLKGAIDMTLEYIQNGDYRIPNLTAPEGAVSLGKYGQLRRTFLKNHRPGLYSAKMLTGTLLEHLAEVDREATRQVENAVRKMAEAEGVDEAMKSADPMRWTRLMNSFLHSAEEEVLNSLVYS